MLFAAIETNRSLVDLSARARADGLRQIASGTIPTSKLIDISSFRTQFCVYTFTTKTRAVEPHLILADAATVAPQDRWAFDILTYGGDVKLKQVVAAVKAMAANL